MLNKFKLDILDTLYSANDFTFIEYDFFPS